MGLVNSTHTIEGNFIPGYKASVNYDVKTNTSSVYHTKIDNNIVNKINYNNISLQGPIGPPGPPIILFK